MNKLINTTILLVGASLEVMLFAKAIGKSHPPTNQLKMKPGVFSTSRKTQLSCNIIPNRNLSSARNFEESNKYVSESQVIDLATEGEKIPINEIDNKTRWMKYEHVNAYYIKKQVDGSSY